MTRHTVTREQFNTHADANRSNFHSVFKDEMGYIVRDDGEDSDAFDQMREYLVGIPDVNSANGIDVGDDQVSFTLEGLAAAALIYTQVRDDYDGEHGRSTASPDSPWVQYGLRGDDDVDYCGSHPIIAIDMLREIVG